ncbi:secreted frizzled-related protein 1 isoform X3 [Castor canadensis]|uniref:Secreted frizzled-related protein 1 isoform X3 n=1 Tax=Castor canadensis TaxID=51338 RepID=A0AC58L0P6_CASCN
MGSGRGAGGRRWAASSVLLALAAGLLGASSANEYDYVSFQSDIGSYQSGRFYTKPPQCVDIPVDLRLCHNVGYKKMVLPNLLEHETMAEVKQQASSWVPLLNKNCHIGTQVFLCSLFAPVCLDRPIYPCRWLCEAVRDSCEPVMQFFGFYWPEMLKCDKFPDGDVCIAMTPPNATEASKPQGTTVCPPCDNELKSEAIIEHLCASEFAISAQTPMDSMPHLMLTSGTSCLQPCDFPGTLLRAHVPRWMPGVSLFAASRRTVCCESWKRRDWSPLVFLADIANRIGADRTYPSCHVDCKHPG